MRPERILVVAPYPPYPPRFGGAARIYHLLRVLAREHRITLLSFASPDEAAAMGPLADLGIEIHTVPRARARDPRRKRLYQLRSLVGRTYSHYSLWSPRMAAALDGLLSGCRFDVVQIEFGDLAGSYTVPPGPLRVLDEHNVEYRFMERLERQERSRLRRLYYRLEARKLRTDELAACRRADAILTTSDVDRATLVPDVEATPIRVVPNGVDTTFFTPGPAVNGPPRLVFTGAIDYQPNTDAVLHFCAEIWPLVRRSAPEATLAIVGKDPPLAVRALAGDGVTVTGTVPDVRPWMRSATAFVVPLRSGGGTRLKILEALASGRAVVSTSLGCEGLEVTAGHDILVADEPAAFAEAVLRCARDPELRARLGAAGRTLVERRYRWEAIGADLADFYQELLARRRQDPAGERSGRSLIG
jgi:glycosyltransferase involved in cell wall biosynthesis